jgi:excisionase family DNA binding protein
MGCSKVRYANLHQAQAALEALLVKQSRPGRRAPNGVYGCQQCSGFHLTSHAKSGHEWVPRGERKKAPPEWITVREAADILGVHMSAVPKMIRRGDLTPRRRRPRLKRTAVLALRDRRAAHKPVQRARRDPEPPDRTHEWLTSREAATLMGTTHTAVAQRARRGRLPSQLHDGRRWFRRDHLELVKRADLAKRRPQRLLTD